MPYKKKKIKQSKKIKLPRMPLDALKKIGSSPQTTKKGKKGYDRDILKKELIEEIAESQ